MRRRHGPFGARGPVTRMGGYVRMRMHRRIFWWFGASILLTMLAIAVVMVTLGGASMQPWKRDMERIRTFVGGRFAQVWDDPVRRDELANAMSRDLNLDLTLQDHTGKTIVVFGDACMGNTMSAPVIRDGQVLGEVLTCSNNKKPSYAFRLFLGLFTACAVLWAMSGKIARRISKPFDELVRVAQDIGAGKFHTRVRIDRHSHRGDDVGMLGCVINEMAARIEKQMADQRELLAAVSHEIRTPLTRIRILMEMARDAGGADQKTLDEVDREVMEIDALVSELLASSRLQFSALTRSRLDAREVAARALDRASLSADKLIVDGDDTTFHADATLVARALANLIDNAKRHGGGIEKLRVVADDGHVRFDAEDNGPGFSPGSEREVFDAFVQRPSVAVSNGSHDHGGLGLGLALVRRIAEAHGGTVDAKNRDAGGAVVSLDLPRGEPTTTETKTAEPADA
ncbi:MAG: HAMP domain-containing sensor histidine kinase [Polyangiales bacterium]